VTEGEYVDGWKCIAVFVGKSARWCRCAAMRLERPMPVRVFGGIRRMYIAEYQAWLAAESAEPGPPPTTAMMSGSAPKLPGYGRRRVPLSGVEDGAALEVTHAVRSRMRALAERRRITMRRLTTDLLTAVLDAEEKRP
jgi:hypothetical protein